MALQYSTTLRTDQVGAIEGTIGTAPNIEIFTGAPPANCAAADSGTKIASGALPSDWLAAAAAGAVAKNGTWQFTGLAAASTGATMGHFRIKNTAGTVTHIQGTITVTGGGGDMTVDNTSIAQNQVATVGTFTITAANA